MILKTPNPTLETLVRVSDVLGVAHPLCSSTSAELDPYISLTQPRQLDLLARFRAC